MDYYAIVGMVVICLIAVVGFFISIKKSLSDDRKPLEDLNIAITKLNTNFENMLTQDKVRDKRLEKHSVEIDGIIERQRTNEKQLANHELRINSLEQNVKQ